MVRHHLEQRFAKPADRFLGESPHFVAIPQNHETGEARLEVGLGLPGHFDSPGGVAHAHLGGGRRRSRVADSRLAYVLAPGASHLGGGEPGRFQWLAFKAVRRDSLSRQPRSQPPLGDRDGAQRVCFGLLGGKSPGETGVEPRNGKVARIATFVSRLRVERHPDRGVFRAVEAEHPLGTRPGTAKSLVIAFLDPGVDHQRDARGGGGDFGSRNLPPLPGFDRRPRPAPDGHDPLGMQRLHQAGPEAPT